MPSIPEWLTDAESLSIMNTVALDIVKMNMLASMSPDLPGSNGRLVKA